MQIELRGDESFSVFVVSINTHMVYTIYPYAFTLSYAYVETRIISCANYLPHPPTTRHVVVDCHFVVIQSVFGDRIVIVQVMSCV